MNKIKKIIYMVSVIFVISLLFGCKNDKENTNKLPSDNKTILYIEASGYDEEVVYQNEKYIHSDNVIITAYFSDETKEDVTGSCFFYTISTYKVGIVEQKVQYVYNDVIKYCTYDVNVIEYNSTHLELNYSKCKVIYQKREILDSTNLVVTAVYPNGKREQIRDYDIEIYNEEGVYFKKNSQLVSLGRHTVTIKFQDLEKSYSIMVYDNTLPSYDVVIDNFDHDEFLTNDLPNNSLIFTGPFISLNSTGINTKFSYEKITYNDKTYTKALNISCDTETDTFDGITFSISKKTKVFMLISCDNNCLSFYNKSNEISSNQNYEYIEIFGLEYGIGVVMFELNVGNYYLSSFGEETLIYSMKFMFEEDTEFERLDSIKINNDSFKEHYELFESIKNDDIEVYGILNEEENKLDLNDYIVTLYHNNMKVSSFLEEGDYEVIIRYVGYKLCDNRIIKKTIQCIDTQNYSMYIKDFSINNNNLDININNMVYYYYINSDTNKAIINFNLYNNKNYKILVNQKEYQIGTDIEIDLNNKDTKIDILISSDSFTLGYSITIIKDIIN